MRCTRDTIMETVEESGLTREDLVKVMNNILTHPRRHKLFYIYASSDRPTKDRKIKALINRLIEAGLISQEKDINKDRLVLTPAGLRYLMRLKGYDENRV